MASVKLYTRYSTHNGRLFIISSSGKASGKGCIHWLAKKRFKIKLISRHHSDGATRQLATGSYASGARIYHWRNNCFDRASVPDGESPISFCQCVQSRAVCSIRLMTRMKGVYGPFRPPTKTRVPLWLAQSLKLKRKCRIVPPDWVTAGMTYSVVYSMEWDMMIDGRLPRFQTTGRNLAGSVIEDAFSICRNCQGPARCVSTDTIKTIKY